MRAVILRSGLDEGGSMSRPVLWWQGYWHGGRPCRTVCRRLGRWMSNKLHRWRPLRSSPGLARAAATTPTADPRARTAQCSRLDDTENAKAAGGGGGANWILSRGGDDVDDDRQSRHTTYDRSRTEHASCDWWPVPGVITLLSTCRLPSHFLAVNISCVWPAGVNRATATSTLDVHLSSSESTRCKTRGQRPPQGKCYTKLKCPYLQLSRRWINY